jgi:adenylate cyclase
METSPEAAKIVVTPPDKAESLVELGERLTIGRSPKNELVLDDQSASRHHAEIRHVGRGHYRVADLGSANGTWVNGRRLAVPRELQDGDQILIGRVMLRFVAPASSGPSDDSNTGSPGTQLNLRGEVVVAFVSDIRNFTSMSEVLPNREFSALVSDWFRETTDVIQSHGGTIDKFIGDAVFAYWIASDRLNPREEVRAALRTARTMLERAQAFSLRLSSQFPGHVFRVGIGINAGEVMLGNVGSSEVASFTIVGDAVNVAFRLESLSKEKGYTLIVSDVVQQCVPDEFELSELGPAQVQGRKEPVVIWGWKSE